MARLGKREREAKRDTIRANLANPNMPRSSGTMGSTIAVERLMCRTHYAGAHVGHNMRGSQSKGSAPARFSGGSRNCDVTRTIMVLATDGLTKVPRKQVWLKSEGVWKNVK